MQNKPDLISIDVALTPTARKCLDVAVRLLILDDPTMRPGASGIEIAAFIGGGPLGIVAIMYLLRRYHRRPGA